MSCGSVRTKFTTCTANWNARSRISYGTPFRRTFAFSFIRLTLFSVSLGPLPLVLYPWSFTLIPSVLSPPRLLPHFLPLRVIRRRDLRVVDDQHILVVALLGVAGEVVRAHDHDLLVNDEHFAVQIVLVSVLPHLQPSGGKRVPGCVAACGDLPGLEHALHGHAGCGLLNQRVGEVRAREGEGHEVNAGLSRVEHVEG